MATLKSYKKEIRKIFFISVNTEIKDWEKPGATSKDMFSPIYDDLSRFNVDIKRGKLYFSVITPDGNQEYKQICRYKWWFIPIDFKVYIYSIKLKRYFNNISANIQKEKDMIMLKSGLDTMCKKHIKSIRSLKLNQIK